MGNLEESDPQLYVVEGLPVFNARQAWTAELSYQSGGYTMRIGDSESLRIPVTRPKESMSHHGAQMDAIREVVQTGTAAVGGLQKVRLLKEQLRDEYAKLLPEDAEQYLAIDYLDAFDKAAERAKISQKITRAAGYIALRPNLWVITKLTALGTGDKRVSVARLTGLARMAGDDAPTWVLPVVSGKNNVQAVLKNTRRSETKRSYPNVLDVVEGRRVI